MSGGHWADVIGPRQGGTTSGGGEKFMRPVEPLASVDHVSVGEVIRSALNIVGRCDGPGGWRGTRPDFTRIRRRCKRMRPGRGLSFSERQM